MAGLDNAYSKLLVESIIKEERARWNHSSNIHRRSSVFRENGERTLDALLSARGPGGARSASAVAPRKSAAVRLLEEKTGLETAE
eukprot:CAMPEP_0172899742 /NCGR_PEP_ID=MMETSP1075-20121228/162600_1 /TAXON_ID=2916 /ORGANISM="Ceratium fusus, Strain PA161109" /LENGTH=84 /DNA_ID=CAMNT_0013755803 /DNA_START=26 /DNA_END=277 /DNA_ORIENTATION=-